MRRVKSVFLTGFVLLAISLAGCKQDAGVPPIVPPDSDTSKSTGLPSISVSGVALEGSGAESINIPSTPLSGGAGSFSVTNGKLTLNLGTPSSGFTVAGSINDSGSFFYRTDSGYEVAVSDPSARIYTVATLEATVDSKPYYIMRGKLETNNATSYEDSGIVYVYVDKDCTITRAAKSWTQTDGGKSVSMNFAAVNLPLKKGWNLVQMDFHEAKIEGSWSFSLKIATKDLPWTWADDMI